MAQMGEFVRGRTLEGAAIGSLDRNIEVSEIVVMGRSGDSWCGICNEPLGLLRVPWRVAGTGSGREQDWSCGRRKNDGP